MSKVKGKKKLNSAILKELKPFGITSAKLTGEYSYLPSDYGITFGIELPTEYEWLMDFIADRFNYVCDCPFILLFLHELGHHNTIGAISYEVQKFCDNEKIRIDEDMNNTDDEDTWKKLEYQYFSLPDEIMATQWAVNYARKHPRKIKNMAKRMTASFQEFYAKNELTED